MIIVFAPPRLDPLPPLSRAEPAGAVPSTASRAASAAATAEASDAVLCQHCGRTASNGVRCQGFCVADAET